MELARIKQALAEPADNNTYVNIQVKNTSDVAVPLQFTKGLPANIVNNPEEYFLSVIRFTLDGTSLPIMIVKSNVFYVQMAFNGVYTTPIYLTPPPPPPPNFPNGGIYRYQDFADMINAALIAAFAALQAALAPGLLPVGTQVPYVVYNTTSYKFQIYFDANWLTTIATPVELYYGRDLYYLFNNYLAEFQGSTAPVAVQGSFRMDIKDVHGTNSAPLNPIVPAGLYMLDQEYPAPGRLAAFSGVARIAIQTNFMGVRYEYTVNADVTPQASLFQSNEGGIPASNVLTDYAPTSDVKDPATYRQDLLYLPTSQYRLTDLVGVNSKIDMNVVWYGQDGVEYKFLIQRGEAATFKVAYLRKALYLNPKAVTAKVV